MLACRGGSKDCHILLPALPRTSIINFPRFGYSKINIAAKIFLTRQKI
jgi:hypothetical protein